MFELGSVEQLTLERRFAPTSGSPHRRQRQDRTANTDFQQRK